MCKYGRHDIVLILVDRLAGLYFSNGGKSEYHMGKRQSVTYTAIRPDLAHSTAHPFWVVGGGKGHAMSSFWFRKQELFISL